MLEKVSLFNSKREFLLFLSLCGFILTYSLLIEFQNYKKLTRFDSNIVNAIVVNQYSKTKNQKTYQVLKLKSEDGVTFYSSAKKSFPDSIGKKVELDIWVKKVNFYQYMTSFYAYSRVKNISKEESLKQKLNSYLSCEHKNKEISSIYQALYSATPLSRDLYTNFSTLGVSHLLAISGFHLGVLSTLLFFLLKYPYKFLQDRYFPYRNHKADIFIIISVVLFSYLLFLDYPPSLLRAFGMLIVGFVLYDRGIKIISMQTLLISLLLLVSFFPRLVFALGFWLSIAGVFYIFLFLIYFKHLNKIWQFILVPFWVYVLMLPFSLAIFAQFSIYHPLSIVWTTLFTIFYPLSIFLHLVGYGNLFDGMLQNFIDLGKNGVILILEVKWLILHLILSFLSLWKKGFVWLLLFYSLSILIYAIYHVT